MATRACAEGVADSDQGRKKRKKITRKEVLHRTPFHACTPVEKTCMEKHFKLLELSRFVATEDDVKRAYRTKALLVHPDRNPNSDGEAFKALQDAYEAALADVQRRPLQRGAGMRTDAAGNHLGSWGVEDPFSASYTFTAAAASGAAYSYARATAFTRGGGAARRTTTTTTTTTSTSTSTSARPAQPPLFSEEELFGDGVPGGWRDVGSQQRTTQPAHKCSARNTNADGSSATATAADAHWRRAHGNRVPLSAYENVGPVPPPPRSETAVPPHMPHKPTASPPTSPAGKTTTNHSGSAAAGGGASFSSSGNGRNRPSASHKTQTQQQWDAFMAQDHLWRPSSSPAPRDAAQSSSEDESAEDRAFREALYLHRRAQELYKTHQRHTAQPMPTAPRPPSATSFKAPSPGTSATSPFASATSTNQADKEAVYQQWNELQSSLLRKTHGAGTSRSPSGGSGGSGGTPRARSGDEARLPAAAAPPANASANASASTSWSRPPSASASPTRQPPQSSSAYTFVPRPSQRELNIRQEALVNERRSLQRAYLQHRYTPDPADVGNMSDTEVYLLAELLGDVHAKVQAVLKARLTKGMCTTCGNLPRSTTVQYFVCGHKCICAVCNAAGVRSCPLCGGKRATRDIAEDSDDEA